MACAAASDARAPTRSAPTRQRLTHSSGKPMTYRYSRLRSLAAATRRPATKDQRPATRDPPAQNRQLAREIVRRITHDVVKSAQIEAWHPVLPLQGLRTSFFRNRLLWTSATTLRHTRR